MGFEICGSEADAKLCLRLGWCAIFGGQTEEEEREIELNLGL